MEEECRAATGIVRRITENCDSEASSACFRFTLCACCKPGIPFFPAAFAASGGDENAISFAFGTENSGLLNACIENDKKPLPVEEVAGCVSAGFLQALMPLENAGEEVARTFTADNGVRPSFLGIDPSINPGLDHESIVDAFAKLGCAFGDPGTLAITAMITKGLREIPVELCGYAGLMLPVCEDRGLAASYSKGAVRLADFLTLSSVCGVGLDTMPISGKVSDKVITGIFLDVCALALKWQKQLSCRLLPCPGKGPGEATQFNSPYLVDVNLQ